MAAHGSVNTMTRWEKLPSPLGISGSEPGHTPGVREGLRPCERDGASVRGDFASKEGESDLGRELAGVTRSGAVGREPQSPYRTSLRGTRRRAQRRPGWQNRGGSGKARSPLPSTGDNTSGRRHRAPAPALSELGARCSLAPLSDTAVTGAPRASRRRQDRGSPSPPVFVSSGADGK